MTWLATVVSCLRPLRNLVHKSGLAGGGSGMRFTASEPDPATRKLYHSDQFITLPLSTRHLSTMERAAVAEIDLRVALVILKKENPTLGVAKIHALLLEAHPTWAVSEKRVRKILQNEGLVATDASTGKDNATGPPIAAYPLPVSRLNKSLDVSRWSSKVKVHYFGAVKGKGLVATQKISEGEVVWKEDPFVLAPEWCVFPHEVPKGCGIHPQLLIAQGNLRLAKVLQGVRVLFHTTREPLANPSAVPGVRALNTMSGHVLQSPLSCTIRESTPTPLPRT